jgi:hypothetical protein
MKFGFDRYDTKARLAPAIITLLPLAIAGFAWSSGGAIETADLAPLGVTGLITFSLATLMMQVARAAGKKGSSRNSGKGGADFQEKVGIVPKSVRHSLEHFDLVVDALE